MGRLIEFRVWFWGLGFRVWGLGGDSALGSGVCRARIQDFGCRVGTCLAFDQGIYLKPNRRPLV